MASRTKTEADRKKEQESEQRKGEPKDISGIPVGEEIPNLEDLDSPSVAGTDLNDAETTGNTSDASNAAPSRATRAPSAGAAGADSGKPPVVARPGEEDPGLTGVFGGGLRNDAPPRDDDDGIDPELQKRIEDDARQMEARRAAQQPNTDIFQTETEQRQAALKAASKKS